MTDALGSTVALADYYGSLQTQYTYEPFGATTVSGQVNALLTAATPFVTNRGRSSAVTPPPNPA